MQCVIHQSNTCARSAFGWSADTLSHKESQEAYATVDQEIFVAKQVSLLVQATKIKTQIIHLSIQRYIRTIITIVASIKCIEAERR